ncbi:MAG: hypothetical protein ABI843_11370 [Dokdonella sp.]
MRTTLYAGIVFALFAGQAAAGTFYDLGVGGGQTTAISYNGRIATGIAGQAAWRWAKDRGAEQLTGFTDAEGMGPWAQPIAGQYTTETTLDNAVAALGYSNSNIDGVGPTLIGAWPGGGSGFGAGLSTAYGASDNGVAVGLAIDETDNPIAFRWTQADGMSRLTVNRPLTYSRANGVSADGNTIYGWNDQNDGGRTAVVWQEGVPLDILDSDGSVVGAADGISRNGVWVVGEGANSPDGSSAWRWSTATGLETLGVISSADPVTPFTPDPIRVSQVAAHRERAQPKLGDQVDGFFSSSLGFAVSEDGNVVVGRSGAFPSIFAVVWTPDSGMVRLSDYAAAHGVTIPDGWTLQTADAISADGKTIGGWGSLGSFVIDLHDAPAAEAVLEAHGTVDFNSLSSGPFAGVAAGMPVTMTFRMSQDGATELAPGQDTRYPIELDTFEFNAGSASDVLIQTDFGPGVDIANDYPLSDGIHLFSAPLASGQALEFELFNPGGNMFDSDDLDRINRTFDPSFFEKISWMVSAGDEAMTINLDTVSINDYAGMPTYTIGGSVGGLEGTGLVLQQSGGDDLGVSVDGAFTFATAVADGSAYAVSVLTQPSAPAQTCSIADGSGSVSGADVTDVVVSCVTDIDDTIFTDGFDSP